MSDNYNLTIDEIQRARESKTDLDQLVKEKKAVGEQLRIRIEFLSRGGEGNVYMYTDEHGNKNTIKILSNTTRNLEDTILNIKEEYKIVENTKKTLKPLLDGVIKIGDREVAYQVSKFIGPDLSELQTRDKYERFMIALRTLIGYYSLFMKGVVHRDLKPENILYNSYNGKLKIIDFGFSTMFNCNATYNNCGTTAFKAPELLDQKPNTTITGADLPPIDIYALGVTLFNIITRNDKFVNWKHTQRQNYLKNLQTSREQLLPNENPEIRRDFLNLIKLMLSTNPDERPVIDRVLSSFVKFFVYISKIENEKLFSFKRRNLRLSAREKLFIMNNLNMNNLPETNLYIEQYNIEEIKEKMLKKINKLNEARSTSNNCRRAINRYIKETLNLPTGEDMDSQFEMTEKEKEYAESIKKEADTLGNLLNIYYEKEDPNTKYKLISGQLKDILYSLSGGQNIYIAPK